MNKLFLGGLVVLALLFVGYSLGKSDVDNDSATTKDDVSEAETEVKTGATLDLSGRNLKKTPEYVFGRLSLEKLDLSNNDLEGSLQAEIRHLQNLKILDLSNNRFSGVPAEIGQLSKLEFLDLSDNLLTGLPNELGNLSNLKELDLSGNNYSEADLAGIRERLPASTVIKTK